MMHKNPIRRQDLQKLYISFNFKEAEGVQNKVFVDYMLYFCNKGRENLRELKISDFPLVLMLKTDDLCLLQGIMR